MLKYLNKSQMQKMRSLIVGCFLFLNQVHAPTILAYMRHGLDYAIHFQLWPKPYTMPQL